MSVLIVTSLGDIVVDLHADRCPLTSKNFLKLCKMKYYNGCLFHKVEKDFLAQTGDRTGTGTGGESVYKFLYGDQARFFDDEIHPDLKHSKTGTVAMASAGENYNASQFYFTLRDDLDYLDGKHTVFGVVEEKEGLDTLAKINESYADDKGRPFKDIRIKHTYVLDDPFDDPPQLPEFIPEKSPEGKPPEEIAEERLEDDWVPFDETVGPGELEEVIRKKEAFTNAALLESIGDIPDAEIKPPENVLFVCKLNPVTQDEDLHTIFSRFGTVTSADIIRDFKTGDSLCYAFIEFENKEACERAYFKMDNTLIDDRRIHVDFSQSVAKLWGQFRHGTRNNTNKGGCFKCGATDHIARECGNSSNNKQQGPKYVLKDDTQRGGGGDNKRYEMLFDEDDLQGQEKSKKRKVDQRDAERSKHGDNERISTRRPDDDDERRGGRDRPDRHRRDDDPKQSGRERVDRPRRDDDHPRRSERDYERSRGTERADAPHNRDKGTRERYEDRDQHKRQESNRYKGNVDHRSSSSSRHAKEGSDSDKHRKYEGDQGRRNTDSNLRSRDDESHRERRHRDDKRK
ncbi:Cyclophilin-type peptidyl-prolyl cis-trans isomerase protein [Dioscorea alata]|uniref:Cyclophilin-type peptidyl-prolyl cis-trans isomerase protein n=2 Tax=Dioscorea alata TaxID=55571 RepID=A0ACB7VWG5_DIOAL|nr:Cyclophilin-type peptidyl-prolyl cis-trans isomerase protein [Dioscorea alata]